MTALQTRHLAADRRNRLYSGPGARLHRSGFGTRVRFDGAPADFSHPWLAELAGANAATFLPGLVNTVPAGISGVPLGGTEKKPGPPQLQWVKLQLNPDGIGYFAAEVTCDAKHDWAVTKVEVVQVADPGTDDGTPGKIPNASGGALPISGGRARWPLAMIQKRASGSVEVTQITFFDLTHRVKLKADGKAVSRHFFW